MSQGAKIRTHCGHDALVLGHSRLTQYLYLEIYIDTIQRMRRDHMKYHRQGHLGGMFIGMSVMWSGYMKRYESEMEA